MLAQLSAVKGSYADLQVNAEAKKASGAAGGSDSPAPDSVAV